MNTLLAPNSPSSPRTCPCETCKRWRLAHPPPAPGPRPAWQTRTALGLPATSRRP